MEGNPWHCDCILLLNLKELNIYNRVQYNYYENEARCSTPYLLSGKLLSTLINSSVCDKVKGDKPPSGDDPPKFLRPGAIVLSIIAVIVVIVLGLAIGFGIVWFKKKMNRGERYVPPVRYTTVRDSHVPVT